MRMSQLLINSVSLMSKLFGCLVYNSVLTKRELLPFIFYLTNVVLTLYVTVSFVHYATSSGSISNEYATLLDNLDLKSDAIVAVKYVTRFAYQLTTLAVCWKHRKLVATSIAEAKTILTAHRGSETSSWNYYRQISIYPVLLITGIVVKVSTVFFGSFDSPSTILFACFEVWAEMAPICVEGQFAAFSWIVERGLMDINQGIWEFSKALEDRRHRANCHRRPPLVIHPWDDRADPFFKYPRDFIPSCPINIRQGLINFELKERNECDYNRETRANRGSDSRGRLNWQLSPHPCGKEISLSEDFGDLEPAASRAAFKAIEEEKQPARNQFALELAARRPLSHLERLRSQTPRVSPKISPQEVPRRSFHKSEESGEMRSTRIVGVRSSKGRNLPHLARVEGSVKVREMRELTKQHWRVAEFAADVSKSYGTQLAACQLFVRINSPLNLYQLILFLKSTSNVSRDESSRNVVKAWEAAFVIVHWLLRLLSFSKRGQNVISQDQRTRRNLLEISRSRLSPRDIREVDTFLSQIELSPINFKAGLQRGIVNVNQFFSILGSVLTSLMILMQFSGLL